MTQEKEIKKEKGRYENSHEEEIFPAQVLISPWGVGCIANPLIPRERPAPDHDLRYTSRRLEPLSMMAAVSVFITDHEKN